MCVSVRVYLHIQTQSYHFANIQNGNFQKGLTDIP